MSINSLYVQLKYFMCKQAISPINQSLLINRILQIVLRAGHMLWFVHLCELKKVKLGGGDKNCTYKQ